MKDQMIRVLIAEDMEPIRQLYAKIISSADDMEIVADVGTGEMAVKKALEYHPDVILMDIEIEKKMRACALWKRFIMPASIPKSSFSPYMKKMK